MGDGFPKPSVGSSNLPCTQFAHKSSPIPFQAKENTFSSTRSILIGEFAATPSILNGIEASQIGGNEITVSDLSVKGTGPLTGPQAYNRVTASTSQCMKKSPE